MLFLCTVAAAALHEHSEQERQRLERENAELLARVRALEKDRAVCGGAGPFLEELERCMAAADRIVTERDCRITVSEDLVRFATDSAEIVAAQYVKNAETLADCVIRAEQAFVDEQPASHDGSSAIDSIFIDGHTDCRGTEARNVTLGSERAAALFRMIQGRVRTEPHRSRLLRKLAVRSFGESRPTDGSACLASAEKDVAQDRRVTISVAQSVKTGSASDVTAPTQR